jgi:hypothetical protein
LGADLQLIERYAFVNAGFAGEAENAITNDVPLNLVGATCD